MPHQTSGALSRPQYSARPKRIIRSARLLSGVLVACLVLALGAVISVHPAAAQDGFPSSGDRLVVNTDGLNLREAQGTGSNVIEVMPYGTEVTFLSLSATGSDDGYDWYNVETDDGTTGWAAGEYLSPVGTGDGFPVGTEVYVSTDYLNIRDAPRLDSNVMDLAQWGDTGATTAEPVWADGYEWYEVQFDNRIPGWVAGEFLSFGVSSDIQVGDLVMVDTDALNIRDDAGLNANVLDTLTYGFTASVIDGPVYADGYMWVEIQTSAITGWVAGEYLTVQ